MPFLSHHSATSFNLRLSVTGFIFEISEKKKHAQSRTIAVKHRSETRFAARHSKQCMKQADESIGSRIGAVCPSLSYRWLHEW